VLVGGRKVERPRTDIGIVFQNPVLLDWRTALGNVMLQAEARRMDRKEAAARAGKLLASVGLGGFEARYPHELSGGMRQRVALARALASTTDSTDGKPSLLLMDEPFSALDAITRDVLQGELLRIWRATGTAILFVTHDVREAVRLGERVVLLSSRPGRVVQQWDVQDAPEAVDEINTALRKVISSHAA
jgi:NitT/TauT family transport system ATP-binding protein